MAHDNDHGGLNIGDPVQLTWNPSRVVDHRPCRNREAKKQ